MTSARLRKLYKVSLWGIDGVALFALFVMAVTQESGAVMPLMLAAIVANIVLVAAFGLAGKRVRRRERQVAGKAQAWHDERMDLR